MRLKEPLYGVRVAGLHYVRHLSLVITMIFTSFDPRKDKILPEICNGSNKPDNPHV